MEMKIPETQDTGTEDRMEEKKKQKKTSKRSVFLQISDWKDKTSLFLSLGKMNEKNKFYFGRNPNIYLLPFFKNLHFLIEN